MNTRWVLPVLVVSVTTGCLMPGADLAGPAHSAEVDLRIEKYRAGEAVLRLTGPSGDRLDQGRKIRIEQTQHNFLFGANVFMLGRCQTAADNAAYEQRFADLLNHATLPFYWWAYEPTEGQPDYAGTERILEWCRAHNVTPKAHPLAWNFVDPAWLPTDPALAMERQLLRIEQCVARFRGSIPFYDAVNEATHFDRAETRTRAPILTEAIRRIGVPAYIRAAFKAARKSGPQAVLLINDYETGSAYANEVISKLVDESGRPLYDVIGIQCHQHSGAWTEAKIWEICERFAAFGKPLHFTEATILSGQLGWDLAHNNPNFKWDSTPEGERRQAEEVERFYKTLFSHPAVEAITWWDFSDQGAWQQAPAGLLRQDMSPKPAYESLMRLIKGKWWTRNDATVGAAGEARFRGFFGEYKITADDGGTQLTGEFWFDKTTTQPIEVQLK